MTGFVFHPEAVSDLNEIWEYVAAVSSEAGVKLIEEFYLAIQTLAAFPYAGHVRPELASEVLRFQVVRDFLIVYAPDEKPLLVLAIPRASQSSGSCRYPPQQDLARFQGC